MVNTEIVSGLVRIASEWLHACGEIPDHIAEQMVGAIRRDI